MGEKIINTEKTEKIYSDACILMKSSDINLLRSAIEYFDSIIDYKDSKQKREECSEKIDKVIIRMEKDRKYMRVNIAIICVAMVAILAMLVLFVITLITQGEDGPVREFTEREPVQEQIITTDE